MSGIDDGFYDEETEARLDGAAPAARRPGAARRRGAAGAIVAAMMFGVADVLDPQTRVEIEMVDPWMGGGGSSRVHLHWDPQPTRTVAEIRDA